MNKITSLYSKIPIRQRRLFRNTFYGIINLGFNYTPEEGLNILKKKIILYFFFHPSQKKEYLKELKFIQKQSSNNFSYSYVFPYNFIYNYEEGNIKVFKDAEKGMFYVLHFGKRLYYKKSFKTESEVQTAYNCILIEQDKQSPHRYLDNDFNINNNTIVVDIGSAEGFLGLDNIEKITKLYVFEANSEWIEALYATFEPWKEKVIIVNKYVSNNNDDNNVTLDSFFSENPIDFIKIDVEGAEMMIFEGAKEILNVNALKIAICTYHKQDDAEKILKILNQHDFHCSFTNDFMLFTLVKLNPPYFRKALIRSQKNKVIEIRK